MRRKAERWIGLALLAFAVAARAEMPYPANPRPCSAPGVPENCIAAGAFAEYLFLPAAVPPRRPDDFNDDWKITSDRTGEPEIDGSAQELYGVKGASVDLAWQVTTGRPDVVIAVLDSGIRWAEPRPDLVNKFYLNRGELPVPEGSTGVDPHDRNGNGFFTVEDYLADATHAADSRVVDQDRNGNGMIDPEDLIFLFSDGVDGDANGYVDDISGWDFLEDDNDPLDEVRYGHGTGESEDSGAEADNGTGGVGTCPNCLLLEVRVGDSFVAEVNAFAQGVVFAVDSGASVVQEALGALNHSRFGQEAVDYAYRNGVVVIASAADEESNHHNYPANYSHTVEVNSVTRYAEFGPLVQSPRSYLYLNGCTNYGGHIALAVPSSSCSSEATGRSAGMAGLVVSAARNAAERGLLSPYPRDDGTPAPFALSAEEVKQILTATADDINFDARDDVEPPLAQNYATTIGVPGIERSERFPSIAGWDQYFGYGRVNADRAVRAVADGRIPPEAAISSPEWFDIVDPGIASLAIEGRAAANRASSFSYVIQSAPGIQPAESDFVTELVVADGVAAIDGALGSIDLGRLRDRMPRGVTGSAVTDDGAPDPDRFTFTLRLRVTDDRGNVGEDRRVFALHEDPDLLPGFPLRLGADGASSPATTDLDGDSVEEIVLGTSNGEVHAFRADGSEVPGWPVTTDPLELHAESVGYASGAVPAPGHAAITGPVVIGDLDRDGEPEVVATDLQGKAYVWNRSGERRAGFPVATLPEYSHAWRSERVEDDLVPDRTNRKSRDNRLGRALLGGAVLGNLDGSADGSLEIIAGAFDRHVYAWHHDGTPLEGWPVLIKDPDKVERVDPVTNQVTLLPDSGARIGTKILVPPSLGDLDGDGDLEVVAVVNEEYVEEPNAVFTNPVINLFRAAGVLDMGNTRVYAIHADGAAHAESGLTRGWNPAAFLSGWPVKTALLTTELLPVVGTGSNGPPALADVDGDGRLEVATFSIAGPAYVFTADGVSFFGRHPTGEDVTLADEPPGAGSDSTDSPTFPSLGAPVLAELGGPGGGFQLLAPAAGLGKLIDNQLPAMQIPAENHLAAWHVTAADGAAADGTLVAAFPRRVNDLQFLAGPVVADIDGDGLPEAVQGTGVYDLHAVDIEGREPPGWPKFTGGWMIGSPAVGDIDGDGLLEVVAATREGHLFAWQTGGDECGPIPWRRAHRDEWGTGNYHMDTRPPGAPAGTSSATVLGPARARIDLGLFPGDDLYCGRAARLDVRFAARPIVDAADFAAATPVENVSAPAQGSRAGGSLFAEDERLIGQSVHLALVTVDEADNRSLVTSLGEVAFATVPSPTPTATLVPSATPTTRPASTPTRAPRSPTAVARAASPDDDGCTVTPPATAGTPWWLSVLPLLAWRRYRLRRTRHERARTRARA